MPMPAKCLGRIWHGIARRRCAMWPPGFFLMVLVVSAALPVQAAELDEAAKRSHHCLWVKQTVACLDRLEVQQLRRRDTKASRDGNKLQIMTLRGPVTLTDSPLPLRDDTQYSLRYLGYFKDVEMHLLGVSLWEHFEFLLVSNTTGEKVYSPGIPHLSPSAKHVVTVEIEQLYAPGDFMMWSLVPGRMVLLYSRKINEDHMFIRWEDDDSFTVEEEVRERQADCAGFKDHYPVQYYTYHWTGTALERSIAKEPNFRCQSIR